MQELKIAFRRLGRRPVRSLAAALALTIGIGSTAAAFTAVDNILLRDLPVDRQDGLVVVWHLDPERGSLRIPFRPQTYDAVARATGILSAVAGFSAWGTMSGVVESDEGDQVLRLVRVAGDFFGVLGARAAVGRLLAESDDQVGAAPVAILSHRAWRNRYGSDLGVLGSTIVLDGVATSVVGVAPEGLDFPQGTEAWVPYRIDYANEQTPHELNIVGRMAPGAGLTTVASDVTAALVTEGPEGWEFLARSTPVVTPLEEEVLGDVRPILLGALAAALLLLVAAVANATLFLLAGGRSLVHELAVRRSLGAPRQRLIGRLMADSVVLGVLGATGAVALAAVVLNYLLPLAPTDLARLESVTVGWRAVGLAGALGLTAAVSTALLAAAALLRVEAGGVLVSGGRTETRSSSFQRATAGIQVALAAVSAVAAVLLLRTVDALNRLEPGLAVEDMTAVSLRMPYTWFEVPQSYLAALNEVVRDLEARPGVRAARPTLGPPLEQRLEVVLAAEGQDEDEVSENPFVAVDAVLPGHFEAMGIRLLAGRGITDADDRPEAAPVVVIDEVLANALWPGEDPVGKRINGFGHFDTWFTVVGVASATRYRELLQPHPRAYYPLRRMGNSPPAALLVRAEEGVPVLALVRDAFERADPAVRVIGAQRMTDALRQPTTGRRFAASVLSSFALGTLLLAALGVYGVFTIFVQERTYELGVRRALGAQRTHLAGLVAVSIARLAAVGATAGLVIGAWASRFIESLLFGVVPTDPATLIVVFIGSLTLAILAGAAPAVRASSIEPALALRSE